jgi:hypothetical protein
MTVLPLARFEVFTAMKIEVVAFWFVHNPEDLDISVLSSSKATVF